MRTTRPTITASLPLGEALRELRKEKGLTPYGAAGKIAISRSTLERAEVDPDTVKRGVLRKIAGLYGVPLWELERADEDARDEGNA